MKKTWARTVVGGLLTLIGLNWSLQGSGAYGMSGGMNGESQWLLVGIIVGIIGLVMLIGGVKQLRASKQLRTGKQR